MKKEIIKWYCLILLFSGITIMNSSCDDTKSYAEMLDEENDAVEKFLESYTVINEIPADTNFIVGEDAPYYKLDDEGYVYMQVIDKGNAGKAIYNETIFFRYSRYNLLVAAEGTDQIPSGNDSNLTSAFSFNFMNSSLTSSSQYGSGIQQPLYYLDKNCRVNLVIKSKAGFTTDLTSVTPYLYQVRYFPSNI